MLDSHHKDHVIPVVLEEPDHHRSRADRRGLALRQRHDRLISGYGGFGSPDGANSPDPLRQGGFTTGRRPGFRTPGQRPPVRRAERFVLRLVFFAFIAFMIYDGWYIVSGH